MFFDDDIKKSKHVEVVIIQSCDACFYDINALKAELKPICHLLALLGAHHILHVSRKRVNCEFIGYNKNKKINK
jgi:hypothetical protein